MEQLHILITGANRGLGLEYAKQYLGSGHEVVATCRAPAKADKLNELQGQYPGRLIIQQMDVCSDESRKVAFSNIAQTMVKLDILINNAGIISGGEKRDYPLAEIGQENISKVFETNSVAPILVSYQFLPLLKKSKHPKIVMISSEMGSIANKSSTQNGSYSASKAALNMLAKMLAIELRTEGIAVLIFHPGWVQTDMGGSAAPLTPEESISGMISVIESYSAKDPDMFRDYTGRSISW